MLWDRVSEVSVRCRSCKVVPGLDAKKAVLKKSGLNPKAASSGSSKLSLSDGVLKKL